MNDEFRLEDVLIIARRRFLYFILPVLVLVPVGLVGVMLLPPQYTAQGTILVESQQIPETLIQSTINSYAQERIQVIRQRVMTRERLLSVATKYDLFDHRPDMSSSQKVSHMRSRLGVRLISVNQGDRRRNQDATIAFEVYYTDRFAQKAYLIANEFMTLFLTEDVRTRKEGASDTTEFFDQEAQRLRTAVEEVEARIAAYREQNADALPEHLDLHTRTMERLSQDVSDGEAQMLLLDEERRSLETQLSTYVAGTGGGNDGPAQDLARLKATLAALRAEKTDQHPDVAAMRFQIAALETQSGPSQEIRSLQARLSDLEDRTAAADAAGDAELAGVLRQEAFDLRKLFSKLLVKEASSGTGGFIAAQIQSRLEIIDSRMESSQREIEAIKGRIADMQGRIARTPAVARGLSVLTRDQQNLELQYQQTQAKRQQAITAENLEDGQKAEKFSILEPAVPPDQPSSPDRMKLSLFAVAVALGAGGACAGLVEFLSGTLRGRAHLTSITDEAPIAVIPYLPAEGERRFFATLLVPSRPIRPRPA